MQDPGRNMYGSYDNVFKVKKHNSLVKDKMLVWQKTTFDEQA